MRWRAAGYWLLAAGKYDSKDAGLKGSNDDRFGDASIRDSRIRDSRFVISDQGFNCSAKL